MQLHIASHFKWNGVCVCVCSFFLQKFYYKCYIIRMFLAVYASVSLSLISEWRVIMWNGHCFTWTLFTATRYTHEPLLFKMMHNLNLLNKLARTTTSKLFHSDAMWMLSDAKLLLSIKVQKPHLVCSSASSLVSVWQPFFSSLHDIMFMSIIFIVFRFIFLRPLLACIVAFELVCALHFICGCKTMMKNEKQQI